MLDQKNNSANKNSTHIFLGVKDRKNSLFEQYPSFESVESRDSLKWNSNTSILNDSQNSTKVGYGSETDIINGNFDTLMRNNQKLSNLDSSKARIEIKKDLILNEIKLSSDNKSKKLNQYIFSYKKEVKSESGEGDKTKEILDNLKEEDKIIHELKTEKLGKINSNLQIKQTRDRINEKAKKDLISFKGRKDRKNKEKFHTKKVVPKQNSLNNAAMANVSDINQGIDDQKYLEGVRNDHNSLESSLLRNYVELDGDLNVIDSFVDNKEYKSMKTGIKKKIEDNNKTNNQDIKEMTANLKQDFSELNENQYNQKKINDFQRFDYKNVSDHEKIPFENSNQQARDLNDQIDATEEKNTYSSEYFRTLNEKIANENKFTHYQKKFGYFFSDINNSDKFFSTNDKE
ncbi:MAG: hypothetical protein MHPSP_001055 [Paramarteilia canceri]